MVAIRAIQGWEIMSAVVATQALTDAMADGWEPFGVTAYQPLVGQPVLSVWLRRWRTP